MSCQTWYLDGTFDATSTIILELFTVLKYVKQRGNGQFLKIYFSFIHAVLDCKKEIAYEAFFV